MKSKTFNFKLLFDSRGKTVKYNDNDLFMKNYKAYDMSMNDVEVIIRKEIAKNLIKLKKCKLDIETISKVTKLPMKEIEKYSKN